MQNLKLKIENYEFEVPVFKRDGKSWVALRPICEILGVAPNKQQAKVIASELITWDLMVSRDSLGREQKMLCVDVDHIGEWIFGINPNKVKPEIKERMIVFRRKLQVVLYAAVTGHNNLDQIASLVEELKMLREQVSKLSDIVLHQQSKIEQLEANNGVYGRFIQAEAKSAASRLAHQRWSQQGPKVAL
jgi:hypothetical protein